MIVTVIFQSTPSAWRETAPSASNKNLTGKFQSTPSAWRETIRLNQDDFTTCISIHSLRMEGDPVSSGKTIRQSISIHSLRMEGDYAAGKGYTFWEISIHSLRMEGDIDNVSDRLTSSGISIHSLRMEGDHQMGGTIHIRNSNFNPLPPHGGRPILQYNFAISIPFQSTPSAWRETTVQNLTIHLQYHFNPLPPHGGRR